MLIRFMYQLVTGGSSKNRHHCDIVAGLPTLKLMGEKCLAGSSCHTHPIQLLPQFHVKHACDESALRTVT